MTVSQTLFDAIVDGKAPLAKAIVEAELKAGADPMALISGTMIPAMDEVGKLFQEEEFFVPELMLAGRAMKAAMEPLRPLLAAAGAKPAGVVVAGAVKGDLHDIGKNLVISMLEGAGFQVIDLGADVKPERFVEAIREHQPQNSLPLGVADGDDGRDEDDDRGDPGGGPSPLGQDFGRRRAAQRTICDGDRRRRLRRDRHRRRRAGETAGGAGELKNSPLPLAGEGPGVRGSRRKAHF